MVRANILEVVVILRRIRHRKRHPYAPSVRCHLIVRWPIFTLRKLRHTEAEVVLRANYLFSLPVPDTTKGEKVWTLALSWLHASTRS